SGSQKPLVELIDDINRIVARRRLAGDVQRRFVTGIAFHAAARLVVEHAIAARPHDSTGTHPPVRADDDGNADGSLDLVANGPARIALADDLPLPAAEILSLGRARA